MKKINIIRKAFRENGGILRTSETNRGRAYEKDSISDILRLTKDSEIQKRWNNFCNKTLNFELDFTDVVNIIINFILPPYESILLEEKFFKNWRYKEGRYI